MWRNGWQSIGKSHLEMDPECGSLLGAKVKGRGGAGKNSKSEKEGNDGRRKEMRP
jgi:hypothetical protein